MTFRSKDDAGLYSDYKASLSDVPWTLEEIVRAQCLECELVPIEKIAEELGRDVGDVARMLYAETEPRQEHAGVRYQHMKGFDG